ncbi:MAG: biopolymer transporter ExbD [Myxococcota bacterium]|jgi:biopolymer transport protein ExbD
MSRRHQFKSTDEESEVNLTPMLDVVFIMLIFFIVTASFVKESGLDVSRPDANQQKEETRKRSILISITRTNEIWIQQRRVDVRAVRANVERLLAENPQSAVVIQAAEDAENGTFVRVLDQARLAGAISVSIAQSIAN